MGIYNYLGEELLKEKSNAPLNNVEYFNIIINKSSNLTGDEYTDKGVIFLPEKYTKDGTPTRLIISCHGSGTVINDSFVQTSKSWNDFFVKMGYAVMDVNGGADDSRHFGSPFAIQSYIKGYEYVIEKYNLHKEVFVLGGSMGGLPAFTLANCGSIPVKALAGFCPVVDLLRQAWMTPWLGGSSGEQWGIQRKLIAQYFDFKDYQTFSKWTNVKTASEAEMQYFLDNTDKWQGYNPMTFMGINSEKILTTSTVGYETLYSDYVKFAKVPTKIWQADTDPTVDAKFGKYLISALKKGGCIAEHRSYPSGGHSAGWGEKVLVKLPNGDTINVFSNEYECYLWFKRWE